MKIVRFGEKGEEKPGILTEHGIYDASAFGEDFTAEFLADNGLKKIAEWWRQNKSEASKVEAGTRLGAPIANVSKIVCIGLNYADHAKETNATPPEEPILFFKAPSSISGPNDNVIIPKNSRKTDWEVELGVVIGKKANYVSK